MALTLATVADGDPMDVTTMKTSVTAIETFINQGIDATTLKTSAPWIETLMVFRPSYFSGPDSGLTAHFEGVSAEVYYFYRSGNDIHRSVHHSQVNAGAYVPIHGLARTIACAEDISSGSNPTKRAHVSASFYIYEFGGDGLTDETTNRCADIALRVDGTMVEATSRHIYTASYFGDPGRLACRKQFAMLYPAEVNEGIHSIAVCIRPVAQTKGNGAHADDDNWRHMFVANRSMQVRYNYR